MAAASPSPGPSPAVVLPPDAAARLRAAQLAAASVVHEGADIRSACAKGELPLVVLLLGIAGPKRINLMVPDEDGNHPFHYACLARQGPEVMQFLYGQYGATAHVLLTMRNDAGETALLRTPVSRNVASVRALLVGGADPFAADANGTGFAAAAAKQAFLPGLAFAVDFVRNKKEDLAVLAAAAAAADGEAELPPPTSGEAGVRRLLSHADVDGHVAIDWAAYVGSVPMVEFLLRAGMDPRREDEKGRSALFWAVQNRQPATTWMLVRAGLNPHAKDSKGESPLEMARRLQCQRVIDAIESQLGNPAERLLARLRLRRLEDLPRPAVLYRDNETPAQRDVEAGAASMLSGPRSDEAQGDGSTHEARLHQLSREVVRRHRPTDWTMTLCWTALVWGTWALSLALPWYAWILFVGALIAGLRQGATTFGPVKQRAYGVQAGTEIHFFAAFLVADENLLGFWLGSIAMFLTFFLRVLAEAARDANSPMAGMHAARRAPGAVVVVVLLLFMVLGIWLRLVLFDTDPGLVATRDRDFDEAIKSLLGSEGEQDRSRYCRTTMVRKPVRSKFCSNSGFVVARMDHWCVWLNGAVGLKNHRPFMVFITLHVILTLLATALLLFDIVESAASDNTQRTTFHVLLSTKNWSFFSFVGFVFNFAVSGGLLALNIEQWPNLFLNRTTNERINRNRYPWMVSPTGSPDNRFDRGGLRNFLEFWRVPGFAVDYMEMLDIPGRSFDQWYKEHDEFKRADPAGAARMAAAASHGHSHDHGHGQEHKHAHAPAATTAAAAAAATTTTTTSSATSDASAHSHAHHHHGHSHAHHEHAHGAARPHLPSAATSPAAAPPAAQCESDDSSDGGDDEQKA